MNYTGYSVLKVTKDDGAYAYGLKAYSLATGATGAGGYLSSYAGSSIDFVHGITSGNYPLPTGGLQSSDFVYTGEASIIGGATPNGDIRGEATGFSRFGTTTPYSLEKNTQYSGALYAVYTVSPTVSHYQKIGIGTTSADISTSGYYEGSFTTRNIYEFESSYNADLDDPTKIITGSGVYTNGGGVSLQFNILNRNGELLTSAAQIASDPFVDRQIISILDSNANVVFPNYRTNGDSTFTFSRSQNIDVFGSYNRNFGIRNEIVNKDGGITTGEFYLYANTATFDGVIVQASGETSLNQNLSNHSPPDTGTITSAADRADAIKYFNDQPINTSGSTGFIELTLNFNESPNFTNLGDVTIWKGTSGDFVTNRGSLVGNYPLNLIQEGQKITLTANDGIEEATPLFFKLIADSDVGFEPEILTIGPYTLEPNVEGPDLNLYNQGDQSLVGDFTIEGGLEGDSSNGGNLNVSGNALGTGIGGRLTGPESKMYLLSGDAGTESDTLQSVTARGNTTLGLDVNFQNGTLFIDHTNERVGVGTNIPQDTLEVVGDSFFDGKIGIGTSNPSKKLQVIGDISGQSIFLDTKIIFNGDTAKSIAYSTDPPDPEGLLLGTDVKSIKSAQSDQFTLFPNQSVAIGASATIIGASPATGSAVLGGTGNSISGHFNTLVGGAQNKISGDLLGFNFIGGGSGIDITGSQYSSSVGGKNNDLFNSDYSIIGGGQNNKIEESNGSFIGGGFDNLNQADFSAIGGGTLNKTTGNGYSFIGGGEGNEVHSVFGGILAGENNIVSGDDSAIVGSSESKVFGTHSLIAGGKDSVSSGDYSFTLGRQALIPSSYDGAAVFADGQGRDHISSGAHTATLDFAGGVYVPTSGMFGEGLFVSGVPVLTGEINPPEVDTLQTVTTRGNETTTSIISTGPYISGVTGLFSGKVGIGTATPDDALTIVGTSADFSIRKADNNLAARIVQFSAGGGQLRLYDTGSNETIRLAGDGSNSFITGNLGIGTTSPSSALEVRGGNIDIGTNDIEGAANCKIEMDAADGFTLTNPNNAHGVDIVADDLTFFGGGLGTRKITTNAGDLSIDPTADLLLNENGGNVGIGTNNPQADLHVSGSGIFGIIGSNTPNSTVTVAGYDDFGLDFRAHGAWTHWKARVGHGRNFELYNDGTNNQKQVLELGKTTKDNASVYIRSTGAFIEAGMNGSTSIPVVSMGCLPDNNYLGGAYLDVRDGVASTHRYEFNRDGTFVASGVNVSGDVLGTGDGNRITNNNVPYLLSGDSPAETQTLQDVCDNGDETTTSIFSTGPYISGVTGLFNKEFHVGDLGSNSHAFNFEKGNGLYDTNIVLKPFGNPGGFNSSYWMTVSKQAYSGFITNGNNSDFYIGHDLNKTALKLEYDGGGVSTFTTSNTDINFEDGTLFVDESTQRVGVGTTAPNVPFEIKGSVGSNLFGINTTTHGNFRIGPALANSRNAIKVSTDNSSLDLKFISSSERIYFGGNGDDQKVGVNTASPSSTLEVVGHTISISTTGIVGKGLHLGDSYGALGLFGSSDVGTHYNPESITVSASNRNTTNSAYIDIYSRYGSTADSFGDINLNAGYYSAGNMEGDISLYTSGQNRLIAKHDGNVGIGTFSPTETLTVDGNIKIANTDKSIIGYSATENIRFYNPTNEIILSAATAVRFATDLRMQGNQSVLNNAGDQYWQFFDQDYDGFARSLRFNVPIVVETSEQPILTSRTNLEFRIDSNNDSTSSKFFVTRNTGEANVDELFTIKEDGNVGIGTDAPTEALEVAGDYIIVNTDSSYGGVRIKNGGTTRGYLYGDGNGISLLDAHGSYAITVDNGGDEYVGIGTRDPSYKLHVSGDVGGTGVGDRITNNGIPYLLSGDSPAETQTLQDVTDNGNTTTNAITVGAFSATGTASISGVLSIPSGQAVASEDVHYIVKLTQAEYDALTPDASTMYIITDEDFNSPVINPIKTVASNYTITDTDYTILVSGSSTVNITLPSATINSNYVYNIKNITTNSVVVTPSAGYIDGDISKTINQKFESIATQSDGSNWYII